jgi:P27 family predicted phage terminase small subunit
MANRPKPTHLKLLQGNPGKRAMNQNEPRPEPGLPVAPDHLSPAAKEEWESMGKQLLQLGLLTMIDKAAFAAYCVCWARWREAELAMQATGPVIRSPGGTPMLNPFYCVANQALNQMRAYLTEFGMTPSARSRLSIKSGDQADPLEGFLFGKR